MPSNNFHSCRKVIRKEDFKILLQIAYFTLASSRPPSPMSPVTKVSHVLVVPPTKESLPSKVILGRWISLSFRGILKSMNSRWCYSCNLFLFLATTHSHDSRKTLTQIVWNINWRAPKRNVVEFTTRSFSCWDSIKVSIYLVCSLCGGGLRMDPSANRLRKQVHNRNKIRRTTHDELWMWVYVAKLCPITLYSLAPSLWMAMECDVLKA